MGAKVRAEAMPPVGNMLGEYFEQFGTASPSDVRRWVVEEFQVRLRLGAIPSEAGIAEAEELIAQVPKAVSYRGIVNRFYWLRELGIIEYVRSEPFRGFDKNFYQVVEGREDDVRSGVQYELYPDQRWGGKRYGPAQREGRLTPGRAAGWVSSDVARAPMQGRPAHGPGGRERQAGVGEDERVAVEHYFGDSRNLEGRGQRYYGPFPSEELARSFAEFTPPGWDLRTFTEEERTDLVEQTPAYLFQGPEKAIYEEYDDDIKDTKATTYDVVIERLSEDE